MARRRSHQPRVPDSGMAAIGAELDARIPPPEPPGLGEAMLDRARSQDPVMPAPLDPHGSGLPTETRMLIALTRIDERIGAMQEQARVAQTAAEARHTNVMQAIATFVPRSEIEKDGAARDARMDALEARIERVEGRIWKAVAWILATLGTAIAGLFGVHIKAGG